MNMLALLVASRSLPVTIVEPELARQRAPASVSLQASILPGGNSYRSARVRLKVTNNSKKAILICRTVTPGRGLWPELVQKGSAKLEPREVKTNIPAISKVDFDRVLPKAVQSYEFEWSRYFKDATGRGMVKVRFLYDVDDLLNFYPTNEVIKLESDVVRVVVGPGMVDIPKSLGRTVRHVK